MFSLKHGTVAVVFERNGFYERNNFCEGSYKPNKDAQVRVRGNSNYLCLTFERVADIWRGWDP